MSESGLSVYFLSHQRLRRVRYFFTLGLLLTYGVFSFAEQAVPAPALQEIVLRKPDGEKLALQVELAGTSGDREKGLMWRDTLASDGGMLFMFENDNAICMWMKNTVIALSVAFFDKRGQLLNIEDMQPQSETPHCSTSRARYALEMNRGWFQEKKLTPGSRLELPLLTGG